MQHDEIKRRTIKSIVALQGRTLLLQVVSLVSFFFLGIFLSPTAIGIFISVTALLRIFTFFTDLGLGAALIQKAEEIDDQDLSTTFTIQETIVAIVIFVAFLATPFVSRFAALDQDGTVLYLVLVFVLFISSLKAIPSILLERKLEFEKQVIPQIVESLAFSVIVVFLAYKNFGVASYSYAILISSLSGLPIYYYLSPWKISLGFSRKHAQKLFSFGLAYQGKNMLAVVKDDLLTFFLSRLVGPAGIGFWGWAQRWAFSPFRLIVDSITKVTFPAYSRIAKNREVLRAGVEKSLFVVSTVMFPVLVLSAVLVNKIIILIPKYEKWQPALPSFYFLCAGAAVSSLSNILVNVLDAIGKVKITLVLMVVWIILTWGLTIILVGQLGFTGIAAASFLVTLTIVVTIQLVKRTLPFNFIANTWQPTFSAALMAIVLFSLSSRLPANFLTLAIISLSGGIIYITAMVLTAKDKLFASWQTIRNAFRHD